MAFAWFDAELVAQLLGDDDLAFGTDAVSHTDEHRVLAPLSDGHRLQVTGDFAVKAINDGVRFILELATLAAMAWFAWRWPERLYAKVSLAVAMPLAIATVWAVWISANSATKVADPLRLLLEVTVFGSGVTALIALNQPRWALAMGTLAVLHLAMTFPLSQR